MPDYPSRKPVFKQVHHGKAGLMPHIPVIWAFLAVDADGDEGVAAFYTGSTWMPMIAADEQRLSQLRDVAAGMAATGVTIRLVKYTVREDLEVFAP